MKIYFLVVVMAVSLLGCVENPLNSIRVPRMNVTIINHSSHLLENAVASFGEYDCGFGYVVISGNKGWIGFPHPITGHVDLQWDENGRHRLETIDLRSIYHPGKAGELTLLVYDQRVDAVFEERDIGRE